MSTNTKVSIISIVLMGFLVCTGFLGYLDFSWKGHLPKDFKRLGYISKEYEVDGTHWVGPRGINEAFLVYNMWDTTAEKLQQGGLDYLKGLPSTQAYEQLHKINHDSRENETSTNQNSSIEYVERRGAYKDWQVTPILEDEERWNRDRNDMFPELVRKGLGEKARWHRYNGRYKAGANPKCTDSSLCSYYGDYHTVPARRKDKTLDQLNFISEIDAEYRELFKDVLNSPNSFYGYGSSGVLLLSPEHKKIFFLYRD